MNMPTFNWNKEKSRKLKKMRGVSFEDVLPILEAHGEIGIINNKGKYNHQRIFIIEIKNYIYTVPFVENNNEAFLKTIIPSRKETKKYLKERGNNHEKI
jgi:uncharacterized DUF497 family protein